MLETTVAGSLPKPSWLAEPEKLWAAWRLDGDEPAQGKRDATLVWTKEQENPGIDIVSGGEQFRVHFVHGFLEHCDGIDWDKKTKTGVRFKDILVGAIDVATLQIETREQVASTLKAAMKYVDPERIYPCTNCGLALLPRDVSIAKLQALGAGARLVRSQLKTSKSNPGNQSSGKKGKGGKREEIAASLHVWRAVGKYASITAEPRLNPAKYSEMRGFE